MTNVASAEQTVDVLEERIIDQEYKIWKKNTPYLYDFVMTHSLEWPSLTCEWLPTVKNLSDDVSEHNMLLGTHTTGEQNYLMVATCALPRDDTAVTEGTASKPNKQQPFDEEKKEIGGYGHGKAEVGKLEIKMKVKHDGEVNRARHMPGNHFMVASRGPNPQIYIWDLSKHPSFPAEDSVFRPQGVCIGHSKEGYALEWSKKRPGYLLTGSDDTTVQLWDIAAFDSSSASGTQIKSVAGFQGHSLTVEDIDWHCKDTNMFGSVGHDRKIQIWDVRSPGNSPAHSRADAHDGDINGIAFNPMNEYILATGSADKTIKLWDLRNLKTVSHTFKGHSDQVYKVEWAPHCESVLASCSDDRRVALWDLERIGQEQTPEDAEDGPPELLFLHGGHTSKVSDFSWNPKDPWSIASVSEDNVLQVWNVAEEIYKQGADDDDDQSDGAGEDGMLRDDDLE